MSKLLFLLIALCPGAWAISSPINCASFSGSGSSNAIVSGAFGTFASGCVTGANNVAGDHIKAFISYSNASTITTSCTDLAGNAYTVITGIIFDAVVVDMCYAENIVSFSGNVVTAHLSAAKGSRFLYVTESSGIALSSSFDTKVTAGVLSDHESTSITTATAGEEIVMFAAGNSSLGAITPGSGYNVAYTATGSSFATEYQVVGSPGAHTANMNWANSVHVSVVVAAFKPAGNSRIRHSVNVRIN